MNKQTLKIFLVPALILAMVAAIFFIPRTGTFQEPSISMDLPVGMNPNGWMGERRQESEKERQVLAKDTEFSKADYVQELPIQLGREALTPVTCHVSIVKSGHDLNNSIHRPELCLPAQGHFNLMGSVVNVPIQGHGEITMTKLKTQQNIAGPNEEPVNIDNVHYYVFVGHKFMTHDHIVRTIVDMKDRVLYGIDQRWCYFQVSTSYGPHVGVTEQQAQQQTEHLISQLLSRIIKWQDLQ